MRNYHSITNLEYPRTRLSGSEANEKIYSMMKSINPSLKLCNLTVSDVDGKEVEFIITNNGQSSSILELEYHKVAHPTIVEVERKVQKTTTIDTFYHENKIDARSYNFVNMDIQGAELLALKGMKSSLKYVDYLYLEVNTKPLYKGCALMSEIDAYLDSYGFRRVETQMTEHGWGDAFYIKNVWNRTFQEIYYVNLDRRTDRKVYMEGQMKEFGFTGRRYPAVDGRSIDIQKAVDDGIVPSNPALRMGALGCSMSHFSIYKEILEIKYNPQDWFLIMEDDVKIHPVLKERPQILQVYWDSIPPEVGFIKFSASLLSDVKFTSVNTFLSQIKSSMPYIGSSSCYAVRYSFIPTVLRQFPTNDPIDQVFNRFNSNVYYLNPIDDKLWNTITPSDFYTEDRTAEGIKIPYRGFTSCISNSVSDTNPGNLQVKIECARSQMNKSMHREVITILDSITLEQLGTNPELIFTYLDILSISLYYVDSSKGKEVAKHLLDLAKSNPHIRSMIKEHKDRIISNYSFYGLSDQVKSII